jgi:hypothetical protein
VLASIAAVALLDLDDHGLDVVGTIPSGPRHRAARRRHRVAPGLRRRRHHRRDHPVPAAQRPGEPALGFGAALGRARREERVRRDGLRRFSAV